MLQNSQKFLLTDVAKKAPQMLRFRIEFIELTDINKVCFTRENI